MDRIAFGGMAEIYRAKTFDSRGQPHMVAVKRVLAHLAEDDDFIQMLVDEAKIASILHHPNIARIYEFARSHGEYFISMEHVDGKDLRTILERCRQKRRPMPPEHAAFIGAELCRGLHAAHSAIDSKRRPLRIVHRDVSPSNVICSYAGDVKLCDFGIAKATLSKVQTRTGVIKGKVKYMSPEQALGRKLDHRSDVFSLGSCMYEMLTRIPPFTAAHEMDLLLKVRDASYRPLNELVPTVPPELEVIVDRCLTRSRGQRYQTAADVEADLRAFLRRFAPGYSRSHLGRFLRKQFAAEIDKDLRLLEEFVLAEQVSDDLGENLIRQDADFQPADVPFQPRPTGSHSATASTPSAGSDKSAERTDTNGRHLTPPQPSPDLHGAQTRILARVARSPRRAAGAKRPGPPRPPPRPAPGTLDLDDELHAAPTVILDTRRTRR